MNASLSISAFLRSLSPGRKWPFPGWSGLTWWLCAWAGISSLSGATYYVSTSGADQNSGTTLSTPFRTIAKAHTVALSGDVIRFLPGEFNETLRLSKPVRLVSHGGLVRLGTAQASAPQVAYTTFQGETRWLYAYPGRRLVLLLPDPYRDPAVVQRILSALDAAYDFYATATGATPKPLKTWEGRATLAVVDATCGAGCGYLGATGIELTRDTFEVLYQGVLTRNQFDQVPFYELGRNFWFYGDPLEYLTPHAQPVTTGYAVGMRFLAMEAAGVAGGPFRGVEFTGFRQEVESLVDRYRSDPSLNWANTLAVNRAPANSLGLGATDLFASFVLRLRRDYGGPEFVGRLWRAAGARPKALNTQAAVDNFVVASSVAAGRNLLGLFRNEWRWPVSAAAETELARICTNCPPTAAPLTVSTSGDQTLWVNTLATLPANAVVTATARRGTQAVTATWLWQWVAGPAVPQFASATSASTAVSFSKTGSYTLRATAASGSDRATNLMQVHVKLATNLPPIVTVPPRRWVWATPFGASGVQACATVAGQVTDDARPNPPGRVALTWNRASGPGGVTFDSPGSASTRACFAAIGTYQLDLIAYDGIRLGDGTGLSSTGRMIVEVEFPAKHYLREENLGAGCGILGFQFGLRNTHRSLAIRYSVAVSRITGQVPVLQVTTNTGVLAPNGVWLIPCGGSVRILEASYPAIEPTLTSPTSAALPMAALPNSSGAAPELPRLFPMLSSDSDAPGRRALWFQGEPEVPYQIEATDDLVHWIGLTNLLGTGDRVSLQDPDPESHAMRLYRAVRIGNPSR